ncbi:hypothetical protein FDP41_002897 [Naegleria fowleri]|uniref:E1 ubiquitin-activating enzyme n=1 Tax=Naegleria fowleri TaxID=5763 RepID=A0A6A5BUJ2_NAEFO|nr:uncharacterized protein FDP41_002897 [Naegleria fowleri]KAF0978382.1 hypothetical protein FDP41_002897 [Naegleria fowleri]CAG4717007.1 unnamed protein product [Naegleria fowleri]
MLPQHNNERLDPMIEDNDNVENHEDPTIDLQFHNRQAYVLGLAAMKRMKKSNVLICGLGGLGVEIAKNVILMGVRSVTLFDTKNVSMEDLSSQFYASEKDLGKNRALVSLQQLKSLNDYVPVQAIGEQKGELLNEEFITSRSIHVVVCTDIHIPQLVELNDICRKHSIKFIACESRGLMGSVFCDFGSEFMVYDEDGENLVSNIVTDITNGNPATVTVHAGNATHGLYEGDFVQFKNIEGMDEINKVQTPIKVLACGKHTFKIDLDTTSFGEYKSGSSGYVTQVKVPKQHSYQSLKEQLANPSCMDFDFAKLGRPHQIHVAMLALSEFEKRHHCLPKSYNMADAEQLFEIAKEIVTEIHPSLSCHLNEKIVKLLAFTSRGNLNPMAAFLGGMVAQEVQKACSGKFCPLNQFLHFDALECLPEDEKLYPTEEECRPLGSRYDGQIAVFGKNFQSKLGDVKEFIVGAGALGCEILKNYAMMGVGCGPHGTVYVTDMDSIEKSNLSRQFLFRFKHLGHQKSTTAAASVKAMNPSFNVKAFQEKVAPETEDTFHDQFWEELTGVTNALDNIQARLYVDSKCVFYGKHLIESGTLGTKGNTQIVIPFKTENYGATRDPETPGIPLCTLKNFPNAIEHTIQWARDEFEGLFNKTPIDVNAYVTKSNYIKELETLFAKKMVLENVYESLVTHKPISFEDCIAWARLKFDQLFNHKVRQLLYNFPIDYVTSTGTPFWGGARRPPIPLQFDPNDSLHLDFIVSAANLRAYVFGLNGHGKEDYDFKSVLSRISIPEFTPKSGLKIQSDEKENKEPEQEFSDQDEREMKHLQGNVPKPNEVVGFHMNVIDFEKDDDTNYHIYFITATSNLRARNYKIPEADKHTTKGIAGNIIPAMVTTTALVTGLAGFEFYKLMQGFDKLSYYKNAFVNIALPFMTLTEPIPPQTAPYMDEKTISIWDHIVVDEKRDVTLAELIEIFKDRFGLEISMISSGKCMVYNSFGDAKANEEKLKTPVSKVFESITKTNLSSKRKYLSMEVACDNCEYVPTLKYKFRP